MTKKKLALSATLLLALLAGGVAWRGRSRPAPAQAPERAAGVVRPPVFRAPLRVPSGQVARDQSAAGSVEGIVLSDGDGKGIAGAELTFSFAESSVSALTRGDGQFRFAPAEPGTYLLARVSGEGHRPWAPEWGDSPVTFVLRPGERISGVRLVLRPERHCQGMVVDRAGAPVAGAKVTVYVPLGADREPISLESDGRGRFDFDFVDGGNVEARQGGRSARQALNYGSYQKCVPRLQLGDRRDDAAASIGGRVESVAGPPLAGVVVQAWANTIVRKTVDHEFARTVSGPDGRFTLGPLDGLPYRLVALVGGREAARADEVPAGTSDVVLRVPASGKVRGLVRDGSGAPVVSFSVVVSRPGPLGPARWSAVTRYDAQGAFEVEGVPAGPYLISVVADGKAPSENQSVEVPPSPAAAGPLTFVLGAGRKVTGRVIDRVTRAPLAGARLEIQGRGGSSAEQPLATEARSDEEGRFELGGVPPGRLSLAVSAEGHHGRVLGGLTMTPDQDLGPLEVELTPTRPGETPRIELVGIGAVLSGQGNALLLGKLIPGAGASQAGLLEGDLVTAVDGRPVSELGMGGAVNQILGAEGTVVVLTVKRVTSGQEEKVAVTRAPFRGGP